MLKALVFCLLLFFGHCVSPCTLSNFVVSSSNSIDSTCVVVLYQNVTVTGGIELKVPLYSMTLNGSVQAVSIRFESCRLEAGAIIHFDSQHTDAVNRIRVSVIVVGLTAADGGILFRGAFPPQSELLVSNSTILTSDSGPTFNGYVAPYGHKASVERKKRIQPLMDWAQLE